MSQEQKRQYNVVVPPEVPAALHGVYIEHAVKAEEARIKAEEDRIRERREHEAQIKASLEQIAKENAERDAKKAAEAAERAAEQFDAAIKRAYFEANPGASEVDWIRDKKQLKSDAMRQRALDHLAGRENEIAIMKQKLIESGHYSKF